MRKIKYLVLTLLLIVFSIPTTAFAATNKDTNFNDETLQLMERFPQFKESVDKYTTKKLLSSEEKYVKFTLKENANPKDTYKNSEEISRDYDIQEYTKEELINEMSRTRLYVGSAEGQQCSWLRLKLEVYEANDSAVSDAYKQGRPLHYMAYAFASWLTVPFFTFSDGEALAISTSDGLIISGNSDTRHANYSFGIGKQDYFKDLSVSVENQRGAMAKFSLCGGSTQFNDAMISTGIAYNGSTNSGWITAHYVHKEVSFGSIGMDLTGVPNVSVQANCDSTSQSVYVER